ncbi:unnamed protein product [marine sediment metagenome]|uniref:Uncharacterized protein n=1 Tax=marine sediment metagenome TaxID=412755 RepID=X1Q8C6_9ZZZZ
MEKILGYIRGLQRPFVVFFIVLLVVGLTSFLVAKFGNIAMADKTLAVVLTAMALVVGYLFGERKASKQT